jgi:phosphoglycerate dehydrogenase-like enzyme
MTHLGNQSKPRSIYQIEPFQFSRIYSQSALKRIEELTCNDGMCTSRDSILAAPERFVDVEIIFSGWGASKMDGELLAALPNLKAYFYGAGSVRYFVTDAFWQRQIVLSSAYRINAIPVAEFTIASIIMGLKQAWHLSALLKSGKEDYDRWSIRGTYYGSKVGLISLGAIGQLVASRLQQQHQVEVYAYDPYADDSVFQANGIRRIDDLQTLFESCDVVSLHAPWLKETEGLVTGQMLRSLPANGTFINTSRGTIVREQEMLEALQERPDIFAVLDLIQDESAYALSPLARLPNVTITPHIAGAHGYECHRMGDFAVDECERYLAKQPLECSLTKKSAERLA